MSSQVNNFGAVLKSFFIFLRFYFFWILFFLLDRAVFLLYFTEKLKGATAADIARTFLYGLWMDTSAAAYTCAVPLVVVLTGWLVPAARLPVKWIKTYVLVILVLFGVLTIANFNIYREWGTGINFKALDFLFTAPTEAFASSASSPLLQSWLIFFVFIGLCVVISKKVIDYTYPRPPKPIAGLLAAVLLLGADFLLIRGGWQLSPMNESMVYFSERPFLNHAAINREWSLIHDIIKNRYGSSNPYMYYSTKEARNIVDEIYRDPGGESPRILRTQRPNVVVVIMESFTATLMGNLGGEQGITPNLEKLSEEGLLFTNTFASGDRTDKGIIAVLSGFPSQATRSIIGFNSKQEKLPSLFRTMTANGYHSSFYYGGETEFFNVKSYMLSHSCQRIIDIGDFSKDHMNSKWGAYDEFVYNRQIDDLAKEPQPFFSTLLTLTNHEPFELPVKPKYPGETLPQKFRSTAAYADSCVGAYIARARTQGWYDNTVFVFVADHGHHLPDDKYDIYDPHRFHIPLLICGGALKPEFRGKRIDKVTSQTDVPAILLRQLGMSSADFKWSRDVLNPRATPFAFYDWDNGFGFRTSEQTISFDNIGRKVSFREKPGMPAVDNDLVTKGKAVMQQIYTEYLAL